MPLTETEATTKWCPSGARQCLGSGCMSWRWALAAPTTLYSYRNCADQSATVEPPRPSDVPADWEFVSSEETDEGACWREPDESYERRHQKNLSYRRGYCGLAGKPPAPEGEGGDV